jgi:hypothetical protein
MNPNHRQHPELHGFGDSKVYDRAYNQKRGKENMAAGKTWRGHQRKRPVRPELEGLHGNKRHAIVHQMRAEKFMAQGLNWRGQPRKRIFKKNPLFQLWKQERESMGSIQIPDFATPLQRD